MKLNYSTENVLGHVFGEWSNNLMVLYMSHYACNTRTYTPAALNNVYVRASVLLGTYGGRRVWRLQTLYTIIAAVN